MTTWLVTRHEGASTWMENQGFESVQLLCHLDTNIIAPGDRVIGTLPINIVAELRAIGARYFHLTLTIPPEWRGKELTAQQMDGFGACIEEYVAYRVEKCGPAKRRLKPNLIINSARNE